MGKKLVAESCVLAFTQVEEILSMNAITKKTSILKKFTMKN
jgi:hypothetical protein